MKKITLVLAALLVCGVAYAAQDVTLDLYGGDREVRDPKLLKTWLEANAADAETRLAVVEASGGTTNSVTIRAAKDLIAISDDGATTNTIISNGVVDSAKLQSGSTVSAVNGAAITNLAGGNIASGNIAVARIATALTTPGAIGGSTPAAGNFTTLGATGNTTLGAAAKLLTTPVANANVTNGQAVTLSGVINLLTSYNQVNAETNTITIANPTAAGQWAIIYNAAAATNLLAIAKTGNFDGPALELGAGESAIIFAPSSTKWAGVGQ